jgi:hypothetical protein
LRAAAGQRGRLIESPLEAGVRDGRSRAFATQSGELGAGESAQAESAGAEARRIRLALARAQAAEPPHLIAFDAAYEMQSRAWIEGSAAMAACRECPGSNDHPAPEEMPRCEAERHGLWHWWP